MSIATNLQEIRISIPSHITLVAVSKTKPTEALLEAYDAGQRVFGENKIQEMAAKHEALPKDIQWHMIGHLQSNKVKYMAHFVDLIHGVDSLKTLKEINKQAQKHNRVIPCLLQAKIAKEETKFGLSFEKIEEILASDEFAVLKNIKVTGLMGMASFSSDDQIVSEEFKRLKLFYNKMNANGAGFSILSMGMSGDFKLAINNGSNMIRVGSAIFGARNYIA